jgi:hypothetical protein
MAMRTWRSGVDADAAGAAKGIDHELRVGAYDVDFLGLGFAVGFNAQLHRHAKEVEILVDIADGAEALVVSEPVNRVLVGEERRAGAVDPLRKEGRQLLLALRLGHLHKVRGAQAVVSVLAERALERGEEGLVAHLPAQHVEDHGAFFQRRRLEFGREGAQAADARQGNRVVGQRPRGDVL